MTKPVVPQPFVYQSRVWVDPAGKRKAVHDGDTLIVEIDLGFSVKMAKMDLRLYGVNCPELPTAAGKRARTFTEAWVAEHPTFVLVSQKDHTEKYGRYLATLFDDQGASLNKALIVNGHAKPFMVPDTYWDTRS